jgi:hypothetical protein
MTNESTSAPSKYYLFVDPGVLKANRDNHTYFPSIVIRDEDHNEVAVAHEVKIAEGRLIHFADGQRLKMGQHVAVELSAPIYYHIEGEGWKVLE